MSLKTKIEWTETTWNPITGCTQISDGCRNCYALKLANRLKLMRNPKYSNGFEVTLHERCLHDPLKWKKPSFIFVNSMSDLFHERVPIDFIKKIFEVMNETPWHTYQILTKRAERLAEVSNKLVWTPNIWQGVSVESGKYLNRINYLRTVPASIRFISFEPLIGETNMIDFSGIDWAIVGGESGFQAREMKREWVLSIMAECERQNVLFYFKQWGGTNKKKAGRLLGGKTWDARPPLAIINAEKKSTFI